MWGGGGNSRSFARVDFVLVPLHLHKLHGELPVRAHVAWPGDRSKRRAGLRGTYAIRDLPASLNVRRLRRHPAEGQQANCDACERPLPTALCPPPRAATTSSVSTSPLLPPTSSTPRMSFLASATLPRTSSLLLLSPPLFYQLGCGVLNTRIIKPAPRNHTGWEGVAT